MLNFNDIFLLIMIYFIMNQNNNILFLFWMMFMLIFIMINFYINYSMSLVSILTSFIFIGSLLVFFMYSMLLFYNNFKYKKNNKYSFLFFSFLYMYLSSYNNFNINLNISSVMLDFNNWWIFVMITMTFLFLIFLCFSVAKEKYI